MCIQPTRCQPKMQNLLESLFSENKHNCVFSKKIKSTFKNQQKITSYRNAARYSASPIIAPVHATLTVKPRPRSMPHSSGAPVPGKKLPLSYRWSEMYSTRGSAQNNCCVELPWCTSQSTMSIRRKHKRSSSNLVATPTELKQQKPLQMNHNTTVTYRTLKLNTQQWHNLTILLKHSC